MIVGLGWIWNIPSCVKHGWLGNPPNSMEALKFHGLYSSQTKNPPTTSKKVLPSRFCACLSSSASSTPTSYQESATRCYRWNIKDQFANTFQYFPIFSMHFQKIFFAKVQNGPCKRVKFGATPCSSNVCAHYDYYGHGWQLRTWSTPKLHLAV